VPPTAVEEPDLQDHLLEQLHLLELDERAMRLGEEIIGNLDTVGSPDLQPRRGGGGANAWLVDDPDRAREAGPGEIEDEEERAAELAEIDELFRPYSLEEAEAVLEYIQRFEPAGVGARTHCASAS
jgi:DNA-directed RNA polymerase specialized sigma54-like protein